MGPDTTVSVRGLTRDFGSFRAVDDVWFEVHTGEVFGFLGANGAGKTTLIRMLCGLLEPTAGTATVCGLDIRTRTRDVRRIIGYMSQKFSLYEDLPVRANIEFFGGVYGLPRSALKRSIARLTAELQLEEYASAQTRSLPLGIKQRLALGIALLHNPSVLFLDEPTAGVDPIIRRNFWRIIYDIAGRGSTVFVTTHYMEEAEYCNRLLIMHQGKIIETGSPSELKTRHDRPTIRDVFIRLISERMQEENAV
ncbi:MAG: ABC transporter ATP-binding protein [Bacteroidota bacterium]|nr:ABC transporter ATP-binding protein [Bacteroidota bacterium]